MQKRKVQLALLIVALTFTCLGVLNGFEKGFIVPPTRSSFTKHYFSFDPFERVFNKLFYKTGLSTASSRVVIGKNGWLFLGDDYSEVFSITRGTVSPTLDTVVNTARTIQQWKDELQNLGIQNVYFVVAPNKQTIFREHMPTWAQTSSESTPIDIFFDRFGERLPYVIDSRGPLRAEKLTSQYSLYYRDDTHWSVIGASVAYQQLMKHIKTDLESLKTLSRSEMDLASINSRTGGDLTRFLRISDSFLSSDGYVLNFQADDKYLQVVRDYPSGEILRQGPLTYLRTPEVTEVVGTESALNKLKVLWLRDSFGEALNPFMAATFSEVYQQHYNKALKDPTALLSRIAEIDPDLVIITVVERNFFPTWSDNPPAKN